jgi:hypothetical protein
MLLIGHERGRRDIHSTNNSGHGNLPCKCDWESCDCSVVRDKGGGPWAERGWRTPEARREPPARGGTDASVPPLRQFHLSNGRYLRDTRPGESTSASLRSALAEGRLWGTGHRPPFSREGCRAHSVRVGWRA